MSGAVFIANTVLLVALCFESIRVTRKELRTKRVLSSYLDKLAALEQELQATLKARAELDSLRERLTKTLAAADELEAALKKRPAPLFPPPPSAHPFPLDLVPLTAGEAIDLVNDFSLGPDSANFVPFGVKPKKNTDLH